MAGSFVHLVVSTKAVNQRKNLMISWAETVETEGMTQLPRLLLNLDRKTIGGGAYLLTKMLHRRWERAKPTLPIQAVTNLPPGLHPTVQAVTNLPPGLHPTTSYCVLPWRDAF